MTGLYVNFTSQPEILVIWEILRPTNEVRDSLYCEKIEDQANGSGSSDKKYFKFLGNSWFKHIFKSISQPLIDCARYCQTAGTLIGAQNDRPLCEFYVTTR